VVIVTSFSFWALLSPPHILVEVVKLSFICAGNVDSLVVGH
jgi:hypothetical protein